MQYSNKIYHPCSGRTTGILNTMAGLALMLIISLVISGCESSTQPYESEETPRSITSIDTSSPSIISDGSNSGTDGFYYLSPLVKNPDYNGTFDAGLSPVVEICETTACDPDDIHATYSMSEGDGSELVRIDEVDEHYIVNWHTDQTGTVIGQTYRLRVVVSGIILGYADIQMAENGKDAKNMSSEDAIALVDGRTLPVKFRIETGIPGAVTVTPAEATIKVGDTEQFTASVDDLHGVPLDGATVAWESDNTTVATVDMYGLASGLAEGLATITATAGPASGIAILTVEVPDIVPSTITAGDFHTCGLDTNGNAYCWGFNRFGQLGDGTSTDSTTPIAVIGGFTFTEISAGRFHTVALTASGEAYGWGVSSSGQLGNGTVSDSREPVAVVGRKAFTAISAGGFHTAALTASGEAYAWGRNFEGQLGDGTANRSLVPVAVVGGETFTEISAGTQHTVALTALGKAFAWGQNTYGGLGDGTQTDRSVPVAVDTPETFTSITAGKFHTAALTALGEAYAWGSNFYGQLGDGTSTDRSVPVAVVGGETFKAIAVDFRFSVALTASGKAYAWGNNEFGQLGNGTTNTDRTNNTPVLVDTPETFTAIASGFRHSAALTASGKAFAWGYNANGQLGVGTTTDSSVPVEVSGGITFGN